MTSSATTGSGAWAATPAPHYSVESDQGGVLAPGSTGDDGAAAGGGGGAGGVEGEGAQLEDARVDGSGAFVPDFVVPDGLVAPSTVRQHMMMVGTARTAVRSPQVQDTYAHTLCVAYGSTVGMMLKCGVLFCMLCLVVRALLPLSSASSAVVSIDVYRMMALLVERPNLRRARSRFLLLGTGNGVNAPHLFPGFALDLCFRVCSWKCS